MVIVSIVPSGGTNFTFEGYFVRGTIQDSPLFTDIKPKQAFSTELISLTPSVPSEDNVNTFMNETRSARFGIENASSDGRYDVFIHFHNDISHTFHKAFGNSFPYEQHIDLEILLDP